MSTTDDRLAALSALRGRNAKPAFLLSDLRDTLAPFMPGSSERSRLECISRFCDAGILRRVSKTVILNTARVPPPPPSAAAHLLVSGAVVSLHTVLGECGFLNNPSSEITAVVPISLRRRVGVAETSGGFRFRFRALPDPMFPSADDGDSWDRRKPWPAFSPEKALVDWLALSMRPSSRSDLPPPPLDSDVDVLDMERLSLLSERFGVAGELDSWLSRYEAAARGEEPVRQRMRQRP